MIAAAAVSATLIVSPQLLARLEARAEAQVRRRHRRRVARRLERAARATAVRAVLAARSQIGVPYVWGAESPGWGFDCSGLVQWAYSRVGVLLPRTTWMQRYSGKWASLFALRPGDLVFAEGGGHVGMYVGGGNVIQAPYTGTTVEVTPLADFGAEYARRIT